MTSQDKPLERELKRLITAARQGDSTAYEDFLEECSRFLQRFYGGFSLASDVADDCVQNTLIAIHRSLHTYRAKRAVMPWVMAIAKYKLIDELRKRGRHEHLLQQSEEIPVQGGATLNADEYIGECCREILAEMQPRYRQVFVAINLSGKSISETAQMFGLSESAVKVQNHRAIKTFRKLLAEKIFVLLTLLCNLCLVLFVLEL